MARRPNYGAEKRQKELQRQRKKEEKNEKKRLKKEASDGDESGVEVADTPGEQGAAGEVSGADRPGRDPDADLEGGP